MIYLRNGIWVGPSESGVKYRFPETFGFSFRPLGLGGGWEGWCGERGETGGLFVWIKEFGFGVESTEFTCLAGRFG